MLKIKAISSVPDAIKAALESNAVRSISKLLSQCDVEFDNRPLTIAEIDKKIGHLRPVDRIMIKSTLMRAGLLK
jgi:hypothetical protein